MKNIFSFIYKKLEYLLYIPLTCTVIIIITFPLIFIYNIYIIILANNILILPLILYIIIIYSLTSKNDHYLIILVVKLTTNLIFIFYGLCYIYLIIITPLYWLYQMLI